MENMQRNRLQKQALFDGIYNKTTIQKQQQQGKYVKEATENVKKMR